MPDDSEHDSDTTALRPPTMDFRARLVEHAEKLFWRNDQADVFNLITDLEMPVFSIAATEAELDVTDVFKQKVFRLWEVYAKAATEVAPPWRDNYNRIVLASTEANRLLTDVDLLLAPLERTVLESYNLDFQERYLAAAKIVDEKFKATAVTGLSIVGFLAAVGLAARRS